MIETVRRSEEDILNEQLHYEINAYIDKSILDRIRSKFPLYYWNNENREKYQDKFEICIIEDKVPHRIIHFIHERIEMEINQGYIKPNGDDSIYQLLLDKIHNVTYIYNPIFAEDKIIRFYQTESEHQSLVNPVLEPIDDIEKFSNNFAKYTFKINLV